MGDQTIYKHSPMSAPSLALVHVVPVIKKMYHADQFSTALRLNAH